MSSVLPRGSFPSCRVIIWQADSLACLTAGRQEWLRRRGTKRWDWLPLVGESGTVTGPLVAGYRGPFSCRFELLLSVGLKSRMIQSYSQATRLFPPKHKF